MRVNAVVVLALLFAAVVAASIALGSYHVDLLHVGDVLSGRRDGRAVLVAIRLPRVALGIVVGVALALAGTALQGMFRNPLADPALIGVTGGAALGAIAGIVLFEKLPFAGASIASPAFAFAGAVGATLGVWRIARRDGELDVARLLLAGIALTSIVGALIGALIVRADDRQLRTAEYWLLGGLGGATWPTVAGAASLVALGAAILLRLGRPLNAFALGEAQAYHVGVATGALKRSVVVGSAVAVAGAVSAAGAIGFVGLIVPQFLRLALGADHRLLLPAAALVGATLVVACDLAARTIVAPAELPLGVVTGLIGGPLFLWLVARSNRGFSDA